MIMNALGQQPFVGIHQRWKSHDAASKWLIALSMIFVVFAYMPTLQFDYLPGDQGRVFGGPIHSSFGDRLKECARQIPFYVRTGRPFVWVGECIEHGFVTKIADFKFLRPFALALLVLAMLCLAVLVAPLVGGAEVGIPIAGLYACSPGIAFMYYRGLNGTTTLVAFLVAGASFAKINRHLSAPDRLSAKHILSAALFVPIALFLLACMIFAPFAFVVVILIWLYFGLDTSKPIGERLKRCVASLGVYFVATAIYFGLVKAIIAVNLFHAATVDMSHSVYEFSPTLDLMAFIQRWFHSANYVFYEPLFVFSKGAILLIGSLTVYSALVGYQVSRRQKWRVARFVGGAVGAFFASAVVLGGAVAPWIASSIPDLSERYVDVIHFFEVVSLAGGLWALAKVFRLDRLKLAALALIGLAIVAVNQNRKSFLEVETSAIEIQAFRSRLNTWVDEKGYKFAKSLLVVVPESTRPALVEAMLAGQNIGSLATWSGDPTHYFQLVTGLFQEMRHVPVGRSLPIVDCEFNDACVAAALQATRSEVVFSLVRQTTLAKGPLRVYTKPYIINPSLFTAEPIRPKFVIAPYPPPLRSR